MSVRINDLSTFDLQSDFITHLFVVILWSRLTNDVYCCLFYNNNLPYRNLFTFDFNLDDLLSNQLFSYY